MLKSLWDWLRFLNPANIILIKKIVDAIEALVRLIEELFGKPDVKDNEDK